MNSGLKPIIADHRDFSFHRTFGALATPELPDNLNVDAGLTNPSQNADGLPYGCTGYAQSELCQDEDKAVYLPRYTYDKTLLMEGAQEGSGCDIRDSLKSTIVYGVAKPGEANNDPLAHRRGSYYAIECHNGDWFDSIRSVIALNNRSVSIGTPWYQEFMNAPGGIIHAPDNYANGVSFHNWKVCGWKTINGVLYLIGKPWIGPSWGDQGYGYFPREVINQLLSQPYTGAFTLVPFDANNPQPVILSTYEVILSYLRMILNTLTR